MYVEYMLGYVHVLFCCCIRDKYYLPPGGSNTNFITNHASELCVYCVVHSTLKIPCYSYSMKDRRKLLKPPRLTLKARLNNGLVTFSELPREMGG